MNNPLVISGEAPETDSEDENSISNIQLPMVTSIQGAVVPGEDSESENDNDHSVASAVSALNQTRLEDGSKEECYYPESLLHQKLRECNGKLRHDVETFSQNTFNEAWKTINVMDQHLIKSQLTLQGAVTSLKSLSASSFALKCKIESLLSANFFHNVKVDKH